MCKSKEVFGQIVAQIKAPILINHSIDLMTLLRTQLTYEGLIDEIYNIKNYKMKTLYVY